MRQNRGVAEGQTEGSGRNRRARACACALLLACAVLPCAWALPASAASGAARAFPSGLGPALPATAGPSEPSLIAKPADQASTTGTALILIVHGENLAFLTAEALPAGISPPVQISETEWKIAGTPSTAESLTVKLKSEDQEKAGVPGESEFTWSTYAPATLTTPGPQTATVGSAVSLVVTGSGLHEFTAAPLPPGLELVKVDETRWDIVGTPTVAGATTTTLEAKNPAGTETAPVSFQWAIGEAPSSPAPLPPAAAGTLAVSPGVVFSAARASCGGLSWPTSTVATQWLLDGVPVAGAATASFTPPRADDGHQLACRQTATADGLSASLTSLARTIHEQPAEPAWPISPAAQQCATAVCMQEGAAPAATAETYPQAGGWWATQQVRCVSAPWTSAVGDSALPAVRAFAEAHIVTLSLQRMTAAGPVTVAAQQLGDLATARDELDGTGSPFPGSIVAAYGSQPFAAHELWPGRFPGATGHPDWFAPGGGLIAYALSGSARSFQLTYSLSAADLGSKLRCLAGAEDGPAGASTVSSFASPEYAVSTNPRCGPRRVGGSSGAQPAVVQIGDPRCLPAPSSLPSIGAGFQAVAVRGSVLAVSLGCGLRGGCDGGLALFSESHELAVATVKLTRGHSHLARLRLSPAARALLRSAGAGGLAARMQLSAHGHTRQVASLRLLPRH
jgi:hypothetical protein